MFLKKKSKRNAPPSLTKDSIFFHWQPGRLVPIIGWWTTPALFTGQGMEVDRPNQKTSPALDVLKSCTMTQWHFYYCLPNHVNLNMPRCDEKTTSASCWLLLHTETFRNHLGVPCGACNTKAAAVGFHALWQLSCVHQPGEGVEQGLGASCRLMIVHVTVK